MEPLSGATPVGFAVPPADRYCSDQPSRLTVASVGLYSSTNLFLKAAPALPPDRYASLMTTPVPAALAAAGAAGRMASGTTAKPAVRTAARVLRTAAVRDAVCCALMPGPSVPCRGWPSPEPRRA